MHRLSIPASLTPRHPKELILTNANEFASGPSRWTSRQIIGKSLKWYLSWVATTTRWIVDDGSAPPWDYDQGLIALTWHGRQFLAHAALRRHPRRSLLVAPHRDGELVGAAARDAGFRIITGSGTHTPSKIIRKRGAVAFRSMLTNLNEQRAVLMTADIPKVARFAGEGPVKLAQMSGAPIHCFAAVTRHRLELNNWDRTHVVLPFGRGAILWSQAIRVSRHASPEQLEAARVEVETTLNLLHDNADAIVRNRAAQKSPHP